MSKALENISRILGGDRALNSISRSSDLILAGAVISIIMMLIFPVPPHVIDILIALNLSVSVTLLFVAIYIQKAVQLSIFPSLLLLTTLYRLGVNISSTRQILLHANAGEIIHAFGTFVVGGNYVVGGVVFLIITIVQFIVVVKGAERVAEVAARFTLDAMPGKQMSIDADLRAGIIDQQQARELRLGLAKESQLYGAMDGAMKFVKGDAIAGIVITVINVIGGLIIGVTMHGMTLSQSAHIYSLLSIGDGLVSQIPALMIAITAGIVTTRVSSEKKDANLGKEISEQLLKQPKALMIAGIILVFMAAIPGFPAWPFLLLSILIGGIGYVFWYNAKRVAAKAAAGISAMDTDVPGHAVAGGGPEDYALTLPVVLEVGTAISQMIRKDKQGLTFIDQMIPKMRHALYQDLGVRFPGVHVRTDSPTFDTNEYAIHLNEVPIVRGKIILKHLLTNETEETLRRYNVPFITSKGTLGMPALWVDEKYQEILQRAGIRFWTGLEVIILHLSKFYRQYASEFIGIQEVRAILEFIEKSFPDLIKEVTRLVPLQKLTEILRRLVQEQVSIKDLRTILEALSEWAQSEKDTVLLTEYVRSSLKRYISYKYSLGQSVLSVYLLDPEIEDMVRGAIKQTSAGSYLALDPDSVQMILHSMRNTIQPTPSSGQPPVLLTAIDVRRFVRKLIEGEFPELAVVSYQEIVPEIRIQPLGRVQLT
ncbi:MAG: EscV/YscV/HrcV family type III secretion system export apparatus protein [Chlamydiae bacterium CG10_big_fil_rev_8_21_14_0_10_42_34]|nr:MAG: EscV/YscV/HrcV family type III secretion system export apparatus protein [Chlamydiae bacterium CG10_big_fil_rev_8_21_14_0_10_42_34]